MRAPAMHWPVVHWIVPRRRLWVVLALAILLALAACAQGTPFQPTATDEIKPGPGLFTGEAGRLVIYRKAN